MTLSLKNKQDVNRAVAEHVAGWHCDPTKIDSNFLGADLWYMLPKYTDSADAVLKLLEGRKWSRNEDGSVWVEMKDMPGSEYGAGASCDYYPSPPLSFPLAACCALLRANGVTVVD